MNSRLIPEIFQGYIFFILKIFINRKPRAWSSFFFHELTDCSILYSGLLMCMSWPPHGIFSLVNNVFPLIYVYLVILRNLFFFTNIKRPFSMFFRPAFGLLIWKFSWKLPLLGTGGLCTCIFLIFTIFLLVYRNINHCQTIPVITIWLILYLRATWLLRLLIFVLS